MPVYKRSWQFFQVGVSFFLYVLDGKKLEQIAHVVQCPWMQELDPCSVKMFTISTAKCSPLHLLFIFQSLNTQYEEYQLLNHHQQKLFTIVHSYVALLNAILDLIRPLMYLKLFACLHTLLNQGLSELLKITLDV